MLNLILVEGFHVVVFMVLLNFSFNRLLVIENLEDEKEINLLSKYLCQLKLLKLLKTEI